VSGQERVRVIGFGKRLAATLLDGFLVGAITMFVAFLLGFFGVFLDMFRSSEDVPTMWIVPLSGFVISIVYYVASWTRGGMTPAKFLFGQKVVGADGELLSLGKALLRYLGYVVSTLVLSLGFLWIAFDSRRQGLHDKIAGSIVVDPDDLSAVTSESTFVPSDAGGGWFWLVIWIIVAVGVPGGLVAALFILGPTMANFIYNTAKDLM
jgi:uncharacterized RDD family membrane protein YckC